MKLHLVTGGGGAARRVSQARQAAWAPPVEAVQGALPSPPRSKPRSAPKRDHQIGGVARWILELLRTLGVGQVGRVLPKRQMCVLETLPLGGRRELALVSCGGEQFLVGMGPHEVQTVVRVRPTSTVQASTAATPMPGQELRQGACR